MLICKPKDNKILIEDKLNIISDLTQNDVIRDFEATGKILGINSYISENIYEFLTPVGSVYTTSILPLVANKTTELSSDILDHLPETLSIGDYICISENSFKLKEDLDPKVNLSKYLISGKDIRGIDSLIEEVGVPRTVLFKASRFELPEDHKYHYQLQHFMQSKDMYSSEDLTKYILKEFTHSIGKQKLTISKAIIDLCFLYLSNNYCFNDNNIVLDSNIIPLRLIEEFLNSLDIPFQYINNSMYIDSLMMFNFFKDNLNDLSFLPHTNPKLSRVFIDQILKTNTTFLTGSQKSLASLQYLLYTNKILSYIDCDEYNNYTLHLVDNYVYLPSHGFLVPILDIERKDPSLFCILNIET